MRKTYVVEKREQNGQFGGKSKTNRTYTKDINVFSDEHIEKCLDVIKNKKSIALVSLKRLFLTAKYRKVNPCIR